MAIPNKLYITIKTDQLSAAFEIESFQDSTAVEIVRAIYIENGINDFNEKDKVVFFYSDQKDEHYQPFNPKQKLDNFDLHILYLSVLSNIEYLESKAEYLKNKYLQEPGIDEDVLLARLPGFSIPDSLSGEARVSKAFEELKKNKCFGDLVLLAFLRWPTDTTIQEIVRVISWGSTPEQVAPMASRSFRAEHFRQLQAIWQKSEASFTLPSSNRQDSLLNEFSEHSTSLLLPSPTEVNPIPEITKVDLIEELVICLKDRTEAHLVLDEIGYPKPFIPQNFEKNPLEFWRIVWNNLENGRVKDGFKKLHSSVTKKFPDNPKLEKIIDFKSSI